MKCHKIAAFLTALILATHLTGVRCRPDRIQACGKELADILQNTCLGNYNTYYPNNADENSNGTRKKRGITQECCVHSCSFKDILQYCSGGTPINATELQSVLKLSPDNRIEVVSEDSKGSTPPPPRLDRLVESADKASPFQKPQNVIETATGVHSKKPWFRGKTPAVVSAIGNRFNFGYQSPPKVASSRPNSTAHSERGSTEVKRIGESGKDLV